MIRVAVIADLGREIFGPVLHVATVQGRDDLDRVIRDRERHGLWPDLRPAYPHRRPGAARGRARSEVGNTYVNRNQIGAVVGSQPFGGEGLSAPVPRRAGRIIWCAYAKAARHDAGGAWPLFRGRGSGPSERRTRPAKGFGPMTSWPDRRE